MHGYDRLLTCAARIVRRTLYHAAMRVLITGASGQLGAYLLRALGADDDAKVVAWSGTRAVERFGVACTPIDLTDRDAVARAFEAAAPDVVIHAAAMAKPTQVYREPDRARAINVVATQQLVELAADRHARLIFTSTDMVFDGEAGRYTERDEARPANHYGQTKLDAEQRVLEGDDTLVLRMALMYGPTLSGEAGFFDQQIGRLRRGERITLFEDEWRTPLALEAGARGIVALMRRELTGRYHFGGPQRMTRLEFGQRLAARFELDASLIEAVSRLSFPADEPRPRDISLDSSALYAALPGVLPPLALEDAAQRMVAAAW